MNPFKLVMKMIKAVRGGASARQVFLGVFLGFAVGVVPGFNLTILLFLLPLIFLNVNGAAAALAFVLGKIFMFALAPVLYYVGFAAVNYLGFGGGIKVLADTPVLAFLNWHIYAVFGAFLLAFIIGCPLAGYTTRFLGLLHHALDVSAGAESKTKVGKFGRFLIRFIVGKAEQHEKIAKLPLFKVGRCIFALIILLAGWISCFIFLDAALTSTLSRTIGQINGAQCDIDSAKLSLSTGKLAITGLAVTNADKPEYNRVYAGEIVTDISVADLLRRRFVVEKISSSNIKLSSKRQSPGRVFAEGSGSAEASEEEKKDSLLDIVSENVSGSATEAIEYAKQVKDVHEKLQALQKYLKKLSEARHKQRTEPLEKQRQRELARGYLRARAIELLPDKPLWHIKYAKADSVVLIEDLPGFTIEAKNIASDMALVEGDMSIVARPDDKAMKSLGGIQDKIDDSVKKLQDKANEAVDKTTKELQDKASDAIKGLFD